MALFDIGSFHTVRNRKNHRFLQISHTSVQYYSAYVSGYTVDFCLATKYSLLQCATSFWDRKTTEVGILLLVNHLIYCIANGLFIWTECAYRVRHILLTKVWVRALIFVYNLSGKEMCIESTVGGSWKWRQSKGTGPIKRTDENEEKQIEKQLKFWIADTANCICWYSLNGTEEKRVMWIALKASSAKKGRWQYISANFHIAKFADNDRSLV